MLNFIYFFCPTQSLVHTLATRSTSALTKERVMTDRNEDRKKLNISSQKLIFNT